MKGMVFTGNKVPNLEGCDIVIYLLEGENDFVSDIKKSYFEKAEDYEQDGLRSIMINLGLTDEIMLSDLVIRSDHSFEKFIELIQEEYPTLYINLLNYVLSLELRNVIDSLILWKGPSMVVGDINKDKFLNIKSYLEMFPKNGVKVVTRIMSYHCGGNESRFVAINGNNLIDGKNLYLKKNIPIIISGKDCSLPEYIKPSNKFVLSYNDIPQGDGTDKSLFFNF